MASTCGAELNVYGHTAHLCLCAYSSPSTWSCLCIRCDDYVQEMLELIEFIDEEFSRRDAVLCFIWSRLRTSMDIDPAR